MIILNTAKELCVKAHEGQFRRPRPISSKEMDTMGSNPQNLYTFDEYGQWIQEPYHTHPFAVADMMTTDEEKIVAYLHDVIEDTEYILFPFDGLWIQHPKHKESKLRLSKSVYSALHKLTKYKVDDKPYGTYIQDITKCKLAAKVKIADITCNLLDNPSQKQQDKYRSAMKILLKAL